MRRVKFSANCSSFQTVKTTPSTFLRASDHRRLLIAASIFVRAARGVLRAGLFPTQAKWRGRELDPPKLLAGMRVKCGGGERVQDSRARHADHARTLIRQRPVVLPWEHNRLLSPAINLPPTLNMVAHNNLCGPAGYI